MNVEVFAEWLRRRGRDVVRTDSSYWYKAGPGSYQAFPEHLLISPSEDEILQLLREKRALALRYGTPFDAPRGCASYYVVYDRPTYDFPDVGSKTRSMVRQGLRNCTVEPISFQRLADDCWPVYCDALERQGRDLPQSLEDWRRRWLSCADLPGFEAWGAFVEGKLVGAQVTIKVDDVYCMAYQQCLRSSLRAKVPNALTFTVTKELVQRPGTKWIFAGIQSLDAPPTMDEFKFHMGFTRKPVRQRIVLHPWVAPAVNRVTYAMVKSLRSIRQGDQIVRKAEGLLRFYLEGKQPVPQQDTPLASARGEHGPAVDAPSFSSLMRRAFDVVCAAAGLALLSPLLALIGLAIKLEDGGPVLYAHPRLGKAFRPFGLLKFRTMVPNADRLGGSVTAAGDPRVTRVGRFLRRYKLDEWPQLWNVLTGDIQLVGARPEYAANVERFRPQYEELLRDRPGITDPATLTYRDEEKMFGADIERDYFTRILPHKLELSLEYSRRRTFLSDLGLIFRTVLRLHQPAPLPGGAKPGRVNVSEPQSRGQR